MEAILVENRLRSADYDAEERIRLKVLHLLPLQRTKIANHLKQNESIKIASPCVEGFVDECKVSPPYDMYEL